MKLHLDVKKVDFNSNYNIICTRNTVTVQADAIFKTNLDYMMKLKRGEDKGHEGFEEVYLPMSFTKVLVLHGAWVKDVNAAEHMPSHSLIYNITFGCKEFDVITMDEYKKIPGATYS